MKKRSRVIFWLTALITGLCIHASSALAEEGHTPESVVKAFAGAYFMLDETMADYMSRDALYNENTVNRVDLYFRVKEQEAASRGVGIDYLKMRPILMKTRVVSEAEDTAVIAFRAVMIRSINPLYRIVGYVFGLLEEHEFETTVTAVKEDGAWKVGPGGFTFPA
ncbi:MAG: hypothetical protein V2J08_08790 [Desulfotignum sp.]|jgi:hypothetical protein|nr:hypothetical protein [Desulfotignum sp.]